MSSALQVYENDHESTIHPESYMSPGDSSSGSLLRIINVNLWWRRRKSQGRREAIQPLRDVSVWRKVGEQQVKSKDEVYCRGCLQLLVTDISSCMRFNIYQWRDMISTLMTSHPSASSGNLQEAARPHRQSGWRAVRPGDQSGQSEQRGTLQNSADNQKDSLHPSVFYRADVCSVEGELCI